MRNHSSRNIPWRRILITAGCLLLASTLLIWLFASSWSDRSRQRDYELVVGWPQLPAGMVLGQVAGVGVNSRGEVYLFRRASKNWLLDDFGPEPIAEAAVLV